MPLPVKDDLISLSSIQRAYRKALGKQFDHIADLFKDYDESKQYIADQDCCVYQGNFYRCIVDATGTWDSASWEKLTNTQTVPVKASQEEVDTGEDDSKFVTPKTLADKNGGSGGVLVDSGSNVNGYYELYSNGKLNQWGVISATLGGSGSTHTYPVAFSDLASVAGQVTINRNLMFDESIQTYSQTTTQYTVNCNGAGGSNHPVSFDYKGYTTPFAADYDFSRKFIKIFDADKVIQTFPSNQSKLSPDTHELNPDHPFFTKDWLIEPYEEAGVMISEEVYWDGETVAKKTIETPIVEIKPLSVEERLQSIGINADELAGLLQDRISKLS